VNPGACGIWLWDTPSRSKLRYVQRVFAHDAVCFKEKVPDYTMNAATSLGAMISPRLKLVKYNAQQVLQRADETTFAEMRI
jgi:hypothetical protein